MRDCAVDCEFSDTPRPVGGRFIIGDSDQKSNSGLLDGSAISDVVCGGRNPGQEEFAEVGGSGRRGGREFQGRAGGEKQRDTSGVDERNERKPC